MLRAAVRSRALGWQWTVAAATNHEVWLLTNEFNREAIERELARRPELAINPVYVHQPDWIPIEPASLRFFRSRYLIWQQHAGRVARALHDEHRFDVAHHITIAADWLPTGIAGASGRPAGVGSGGRHDQVCSSPVAVARRPRRGGRAAADRCDRSRTETDR